ncbi:RNA polymerase sigma factor [Alkalihalobacterium elongatum]|uniref:RNA polymerase sigma factor n=1 Tax=Alkalihalobacterium elongatum TaxID=2675466 RepID=UPI001F176ADC|nr:RNA polymerase sigma factor [Alkalihalobacterium elongatum]
MEQEDVIETINAWYTLHSRELFQYIFFMIHEHEQAKDLMQDTFVRAHSHFHLFDGNNAKGWLFRIARNVTIDYLRKKRTKTIVTNPFFLFKTSNPSAEHIVTANETERELYFALSKLKRNYRDVIILRKIKGFSIDETTKILGWSESKVKTTLVRGLKALKKQLEKEGYSHERTERDYRV